MPEVLRHRNVGGVDLLRGRCLYCVCLADAWTGGALADPVDNAFENLPCDAGKRRRFDVRDDVTRQHPFDMIASAERLEGSPQARHMQPHDILHTGLVSGGRGALATLIAKPR